MRTLIFVFGAASLLLMTTEVDAQCWKLTNEFCSTIGVGGTACTAQACDDIGAGVFECPSGAHEQYRIVPVGTFVKACSSSTSGQKNCSTAGGATTWCVGRKDCGNAGKSCIRPIGGGPRFCKASTGANPANVGGLTAASLSGGTCPGT